MVELGGGADVDEWSMRFVLHSSKVALTNGWRSHLHASPVYFIRPSDLP
jgi:hypothetical protein